MPAKKGKNEGGWLAERERERERERIGGKERGRVIETEGNSGRGLTS